MYPVAGSGQCDSRFLRPAPTMLSVTILQSYNLEIILYKLVRVLAVTGKVGLCLVNKFFPSVLYKKSPFVLAI